MSPTYLIDYVYLGQCQFNLNKTNRSKNDMNWTMLCSQRYGLLLFIFRVGYWQRSSNGI